MKANKRIAIVLVAAMLAMLAPATTANTNSDYNGAGIDVVDFHGLPTGINGTAWASTDDECTAFIDPDTFEGPTNGNNVGTSTDANGIKDFPDATEDDTCDNNDPYTRQTTYYTGEQIVVCTNVPGTTPSTHCLGGIAMYADTSFSGGQFGGDYPNATKVVIKSETATVGFVFRACYVDTTSGAFACVTGNPVCLAAGATYSVTRVSGGGDLQVPDTSTIDRVLGWRVLQVPFPAPICGALPGAVTATRDMHGAWYYQQDPNNNTNDAHNMHAEAVIDSIVGNPDGTCTIVWHAFANAPSYRYSEARVGFYANNSGIEAQRGSWISGPMAGASEFADESDINTVVWGDWVTVVATAWGIGGQYVTAQSGPWYCEPVVPSVLSEPICVTVMVVPGGPMEPVCSQYLDSNDDPQTPVCVPVTVTDGFGFECTAADACVMDKVVTTAAFTVEGDDSVPNWSEASVSCGNDVRSSARDDVAADLSPVITQGIKTTGDYVCTMTFHSANLAGRFVGVAACFDP